jgi:hypothetical protein
VDQYFNFTPDWTHSVHASTSGGATDERNVLLTNGRGTYGIDLTMTGPSLGLTFDFTADPALGVEALDALFVGYGVEPNPDAAQLHLTQNSDGTYSGSLDLVDADMQVDPASVVFDTDHTIKNADGTSSVPFTALTLGGDKIAGTATLSATLNTTSGNLVVGAPPSGTQLTITGCLNQTETSSGQFIAPAGSAPIANLECKASFLPVATTYPSTTPTVVIGTTSQAAVIVNIIDTKCWDESTVWDEGLQKCVPKS